MLYKEEKFLTVKVFAVRRDAVQARRGTRRPEVDL